MAWLVVTLKSSKMATDPLILCSGIIGDFEPYFDVSNLSNSENLKIISYNMHGYKQGKTFIESVLHSNKTDLILIQEHWLSYNIDILL